MSNLQDPTSQFDLTGDAHTKVLDLSRSSRPGFTGPDWTCRGKFSLPPDLKTSFLPHPQVRNSVLQLRKKTESREFHGRLARNDLLMAYVIAETGQIKATRLVRFQT